MRGKLIQWFWCASFRGEYESSSATLAERDSPVLRAWLAGGNPPPVVDNFEWDPDRWRTVTSKQQGLFKATMALILSQAPRDFHTGAPLTAELIAEKKIDDHHVFPRAYLREVGHGSEVDSVLNHALINRETNVRISKNPPSRYLTEIRAAIGTDLDTVLASHLLPHEPDSPLEQDDYDDFLNWRLENLHELLLTNTGSAGTTTTPKTPTHLRKLDARLEQIELSLRRMIDQAFEGNPGLLPEHVKQPIRERHATAVRDHPTLTPFKQMSLADQLQFADLP
ncbi:MAG: hypothetical protein ACYC91_19560 [Solirubrobacteraceae bacterium]